MKKWVLAVQGLLAASGISVCVSAHINEAVQTTNWQVSQQRLQPNGPLVCAASATFLDFPGAMFAYEEVFAIGADGRGELREDYAEPLPPDWQMLDESLAGPVRKHQAPRTRSVWFDHEPRVMAQEISIDGRFVAADATLMDLRATGDLISHLNRNKTFSVVIQPRSTQISNGRPVEVAENVMTRLFRDGPNVASGLRACTVALRQGRPFVMTTGTVSSASAPLQTLTFQQRLSDVQRNVQTARAGQRPVELARLGELQADALRLGEAKQTLSKAINGLKGAPASSEVLGKAQHELLEVLLNREEFEEAEQLGAQTSDSALLRASMAIRRGDYDGGSKQFLALAERAVGQPLANFNLLSELGPEADASLRERQGSAIRDLLLTWAEAGAGQEDMNRDMSAENPGIQSGLYSSAAPPSALAAASLDWVEPDVLGSGVSDEERQALARSAYLRGESLRRGGFLQSVDTYLDYALGELKGVSGGDGLRWRVRIALAALKADRSQDLRALHDAQSLPGEIQSELGEDSVPWMESVSLLSMLQRRTGDARSAQESAEAGVAVAQRSLPANHSLLIQLRLRVAEAQVSAGAPRDATRTVAQALGLSDIPTVTKENMDAVYRRANAAHNTQQEYEILRSAVGLPVLRAQPPVLVRLEYLRAARILQEAQALMPGSPDQLGMMEVVDALRQYESLQLKQAVTRHANFALEPGYGLRGLLRDYPTSLDRRIMDKLPAGVWVRAHQIQEAANSQLGPLSLLPGETRLTIQPGKDLDALELFLRDLRTLPGELKPNDKASTALVVMQAASGGEVLSTVALRAAVSARVANYTPGARANASAEILAGARTVAAEAFVRRLRALIRDLSESVTADRMEVRRRYLQLVHSAMFERSEVYEAFPPRYTALSDIYGSAYGASAEGIQKRLLPGEAAVIWLPFERTTQIIVIRPEHSIWLETNDGRVALERSVQTIKQSLQDALTRVESGGTPSVAEFPAAEAYALYLKLFAPLEEELNDVKHLYVAPMGPLGALPMGLLVTDAPKVGQEPHWLDERFAATRMPTLLGPEVFDLQLNGSKPPASPIFVIGDPASPVNEGATSGLNSAIAKSHAQGPLHARREMEGAARLMGQTDFKKVILAGDAATRGGVMKQLHDRSERVLMFVTHGLVSSDIAGIGEPALVLSPPAQPSLDDDGLLRASDIVGININADLVMLMACSTAPSGDDGAEPLSGLASAFLAAGARRVLASYWTLRSDAAETLTLGFLRAAYKRNLPPAFALQLASRELRGVSVDGVPLSHPVFWAPFGMIGFPLGRSGGAGGR